MYFKKFIQTFLVLLAVFSANCSFAENRPMAGFHKKTAQKSAQNKISAEDTMNTYMKDMEQRIKSNWFPPQDNFKNKTVVIFQIMNDGTITSSRVSESSGDKQFDQNAIKAVRQTGKVAPLPKNILGCIDITFTFERVSYLVKKDNYNH